MRYPLFFFSAIVVIVTDQLSKLLVKSNLEVGESITLIPKLLNATYFQNTGAGFGILEGKVILLTFISLMVIGYLLFSLDKIKQSEKLLQACLGFVLGGAVGNVIDRIAYRYVVDFIDLGWWPIFNIADACLSVGVIGLIWHFWNHD